MKRILKFVLIILAVILIAIQFVPKKLPGYKPANENNIVNSNVVNDEILTILKTSCFDCHSNQTQFPWYSRIAPSSWLLANHVNHGRAELNFSEWESYSKRQKIGKLEAIKEEVAAGEMPLKSYILLHRQSGLNPQQVATLVKWTEETTEKILK